MCSMAHGLGLVKTFSCLLAMGTPRATRIDADARSTVSSGSACVCVPVANAPVTRDSSV